MEDPERIARELFKKEEFEITDEGLNFIFRAAKNSEDFDYKSWSTAVSAYYLANKLKKSLELHADALIKSSDASDRNAKSLTKATWVLAIFTIVLAFVGLIQFVYLVIK